MDEAVLQEMDTHISRHQNTVTQFIATSPIINLCLAAYQRSGSRISQRWCKQDGVDV